MRVLKLATMMTAIFIVVNAISPFSYNVGTPVVTKATPPIIVEATAWLEYERCKTVDMSLNQQVLFLHGKRALLRGEYARACKSFGGVK